MKKRRIIGFIKDIMKPILTNPNRKHIVNTKIHAGNILDLTEDCDPKEN